MTQSVICAGHVNWDVTLYVDRLPSADGEATIVDQSQSGGGSASNTAYALATLGLAPTLLGSIGGDNYGSFVREELTEVGVDCAHLQTIEDGVTTIKYLVVDESGQVMVLANDGANEAFSASSLPDAALEEAAHLHLTGQRPDTATELARRAVQADIPVSFDPGRRLDIREYEEVYHLSDVVFLNESEATKAQDTALFDDIDGVTVIKHGADGASALTDSQQITHDGFDASPIDTTGAGDAFAAGFIAARLDNSPLERAVAIGNACGAQATQSTGARTKITWDAIEQSLR